MYCLCKYFKTIKIDYESCLVFMQTDCWNTRHTPHEAHYLIFWRVFFRDRGIHSFWNQWNISDTFVHSVESVWWDYRLPRLHILLQMQLCKQWNSAFFFWSTPSFFGIFKVFFFECIPRIKVKTLCRAAISIRCVVSTVLFLLI